MSGHDLGTGDESLPLSRHVLRFVLFFGPWPFTGTKLIKVVLLVAPFVSFFFWFTKPLDPHAISEEGLFGPVEAGADERRQSAVDVWCGGVDLWLFGGAGRRVWGKGVLRKLGVFREVF